MQEYELFLQEVPTKGIAYLKVMDATHLRHGVDAAIAAGATKILVAGPVAEGEGEGLTLVHSHDMLYMERPLDHLPPLSGKLRLEPLTLANGPVYIALFNESFFHVPNGATIDRRELERLLRPGVLAGLVYLGTRPIGVYDCELEEIPLIDGIGLTKDMRGKGLGRELLFAVLHLLAGEGQSRCRLMVATSNREAFALYRKEGFVVSEKKSGWYEVRCHG